MKLENEKCSNAFLCAIRGVIQALKTERNLKFDIFVAIITFAAGFALRISQVEWLVCILSVGAILFAELMNTAIESVVDLYTREKNPQARKSKRYICRCSFCIINARVGCRVNYICS